MKPSTSIAGFFALLSIPFVFSGYWVMVTCSTTSWETRGQFGDMFGALTALINALGLLGIFLTFRQQLHALEVQNGQLEAQNEQLRLQTGANTVTTLSMFHDRWNSRSMLLAREHVADEHLTKVVPRMNWGRLTVASFFEEMGILVKAQGIDEKAVWHLYCYALEGYFELINPSIEQVEEESQDQKAFSEFRLLVARMRAINVTEKSADFAVNGAEQDYFAGSEKTICARLLERTESIRAHERN